jgi:hypothetical protein
MINDTQLYFSNAQAFSADANSTNVLDMSSIRQWADGRPMAIYIKTTVNADHTTGNETYTFNLVTDDNASLTSATTVLSTAVLYSDLVTTKIVQIAIPEGAVFEQYAAIAFDGEGNTPTVTATIWLGERNQLPSVKTYAKGYSV